LFAMALSIVRMNENQNSTVKLRRLPLVETSTFKVNDSCASSWFRSEIATPFPSGNCALGTIWEIQELGYAGTMGAWQRPSLRKYGDLSFHSGQDRFTRHRRRSSAETASAVRRVR